MGQGKRTEQGREEGNDFTQNGQGQPLGAGGNLKTTLLSYNLYSTQCIDFSTQVDEF